MTDDRRRMKEDGRWKTEDIGWISERK